MSDYVHILVEVHGEGSGRVGLIRLHRPKVLNALCDELMEELQAALRVMESDDDIGCIILTGDERAFAAGADIGEMVVQDYSDVHLGNFIGRNWEMVSKCRKPVIAAVSGYVLGGGCELALMCDMIIAADNVQFGQPEVKIGTVTGAGGSQRLARFIGKSKAMDMCLTGRMMGAEEAERCGLVARVVSVGDLLEEALGIGFVISGYSRPVVMLQKECVNHAYEGGLSEGLRFERNMFYGTFGLEDRSEGMGAFLEKRKAKFKHR